jgi:hypothetical protein
VPGALEEEEEEEEDIGPIEKSLEERCLISVFGATSRM